MPGHLEMPRRLAAGPHRCPARRPVERKHGEASNKLATCLQRACNVLPTMEGGRCGYGAIPARTAGTQPAASALLACCGRDVTKALRWVFDGASKGVRRKSGVFALFSSNLSCPPPLSIRDSALDVQTPGRCEQAATAAPLRTLDFEVWALDYTLRTWCWNSPK